MFRVICFITGLLFGSIPTGYMLARMYGIDLRKVGSGNIGSTNVLRNLGKKAGAITMIGDILKAVIPMAITAAVFGSDESVRFAAAMYTGLGAVVGHDFSPWLGFKGGKGIATSGGVLLFCDPKCFLIAFALLVAIALITRYVSFASLSSSIVFLCIYIPAVLGYTKMGWSFYPLSSAPEYKAELVAIVLIMVTLAVVRHKENIVRLINGNENKLW